MEDRAFEQELMDTYARLRRMRPGDDTVPRGVTGSEMHALVGIHLSKKRTGGARPGAIAAHLHITKSAFSQTLKSLEEKGLVMRESSKADSRAIELEVTEAGRLLLEEGESQRKQFVESLLDYIGRDDLECCLRVMNKVIEYQEQAGFKSCDSGHGDRECM